MHRGRERERDTHTHTYTPTRDVAVELVLAVMCGRAVVVLHQQQDTHADRDGGLCCGVWPSLSTTVMRDTLA